MSSVEQAVADTLRNMSDRDLDFALNYQHLEPSMRQSMEREVSRRQYWGSKSHHTGFTSRDGSLVIPAATQSLTDKLKSVDWVDIAEKESQWMNSVLNKEINLEIDNELIAALTKQAFSSGIKSMYYKRLLPPPGLLPAPTGFTEAPEPIDFAELLGAYKMRNSNASIDAIIAADKDLQMVTPSRTDTFQSIGRSLRTSTAAGGKKTVFFDIEATFDFDKYQDLTLEACNKKEYIMDNDILFMYPQTVKVLDYPGLLLGETVALRPHGLHDDIWKNFRGLTIQPAHTAIKARAPDACVHLNSNAAADGIYPVTSPTFEMKVLKNREFGKTEACKFDIGAIGPFMSWTAGNTKKSSEEDLADTMSLIFDIKEDA